LSADPYSFYLLRFLLGIAEAGFFPGIILYLTYWFPYDYRARIVAVFMTAVAFAGVFGSPLSGWILGHASGWTFGKPWQWLFIIEGIPSILVGIAIPFLLCDGPAKAGWLDAGEKKMLIDRLAADEYRKLEEGWGRQRAIDALRSPLVWTCCLIYFCFTIGLYGVSFWLPQIIESSITHDRFEIGLYAAIPWSCAAVGMVWFGLHSDRTGERRLHISLAALTGAVAFILSGVYRDSPIMSMISLSIGTTALMSVVAGFWSIPSAMLSGTAMATGIALINSVGNLGGYVSPEIFAFLRSQYHLGAGLMAMGVFLGIGGLITFLIWKK
jgi:MFS family permease